MLPQQPVRANQRVVISGQLLTYRILNQTVCRGIILLLVGETYSAQNTQAIGVEREYWIRTGEQQNLLRSGITDAGESLQSLFRLRKRLLENRPQIAVELLIRDFRNGEEFFRAYVWEYASLPNSCQSGVRSSKNLFGAGSNRLF
ncbi:MAG: hypothetical protein ABSC41_21605 [Acidimicrobiales bacterium]